MPKQAHHALRAFRRRMRVDYAAIPVIFLRQRSRIHALNTIEPPSAGSPAFLDKAQRLA
jgi:hypothetical protein